MNSTLEKPTLDMKTYFPLDFDFGSTSENLGIFVDTPHEIITDDLAATGLDTVLFGQENFDTLSLYWRESSKTGNMDLDKMEDIKKKQKLFDSTDKLKLNIRCINTLLTNAKEYVDGIESGKTERDPKIDKALNNALSKIAYVSPESIEKLLKDHNEDLIYINKLTDLIKDQITVTQKLTSEILQKHD